MVSNEIAQKWIDEAEADDRLKPILIEVETSYKLGIALAAGVKWESSVKGKDAVIRMADTNRPFAAFAHELLHLQLSARGYRHILGNGTHDLQQRLLVHDLLIALDNELQHHRMFADFVGAGFDGSEFYNDSDDASWSEVEAQINALTETSPASTALFSYLTLIAPGGGWPDRTRETLLDLLRRKVSSEVWGKLVAIKATIEAWRKQKDLDPINTITAIFETLGDLDGTWIGEHMSDYPKGAFIPRSLTQEQFEN